MSDKSIHTEVFVIEGLILSFPKLFQPEPYRRNGIPQGKPYYSAALLFDEKIKDYINSRALDLAKKKYVNGEWEDASFGWPVNACNTNKYYLNNPRTSPLFYVNATAKEEYPPRIVDQLKNPVLDRGVIYSGMICAAGITIYTRPHPARPGEVGVGLGIGLYAIMKTGDGEPLAGDSVNPDELFSGVRTQTPSGSPFHSPNGAPASFPPAGTPLPDWM